jgi:Cu/Ag efflux protein CusF
VRVLFSSLFLALIVACSPKRTELTGPLKHYAFSGEIVSLNSKAQTASINAAAIPNYMEAMTMEYPISSKAEFSSLHAGDRITATLDVSAAGDDYALSNIRKLTRSK